MKHTYSPIDHVTYDERGILIPTENMTEECILNIMEYFTERKEDE